VDFFWKSSFTVPVEAVELFLESTEADTLSIAAFEIAESENGAAADWRVEMLHKERPDRDDLEVLLEPLVVRAALGSVSINIDKVRDADWVKQVQTDNPPRQISRFWIHGSHVKEEPPKGTTAIHIDAGLAFGSGEHPTTEGCLRAIDYLAKRRRFRQVLDMGCGAGMLAIAAAKCWSTKVLAVDNDPAAVQVAADNMKQNRVAAQVQAVLSDGYAHPLLRRRRPFDLVLANILADPLCAMARDLSRHLAPGGVVVLSGLLSRQAERVMAVHHGCGMRLRKRIDIGPWTTLMMSRKKA